MKNKPLTILLTIFALCTCLFTLSACDVSLNENKPHEHSFTNYVSDNNATDIADGTKTATCDGDDCDATDTIIDVGSKLISSQGLKYTLNSDKQSYSVEGLGTCTDTNIIIPSTYENKPVTRIGVGAFCDCWSLTSIEIPNSVTSIGGGAFLHCGSLISINVNDNNSKYKDIDGNLYSKDGTTLIKYATGKTQTSFTIPNSVTSIDNSAFSDCWSLTSIEIPNSVTTIGDRAFAGCRKLTSIEIPNSVTSIGTGAFISCFNLTSIIVDDNNTVYKDIDGNLYSKDGTILIQYAIDKTQNSFTIPNSVTSIDNFAFYECVNLTSVTIGNSVTSIGGYAFYLCSSLASITIPNGVTSIGDFVFSGCFSLTSINYSGTTAQWESIRKGLAWENCVNATIYCSNGNINI